MTDTVRTEADLLTRIQKQMPFGREGDSAVTSSKDQVIPQDLRDLIVSIFDATETHTAYGSIAMDSESPASPQTLEADTPEVLAGWTTSFSGVEVTAAHASGSITPAVSGDYLISSTVSFTTATASNLGWRFYAGASPLGPHMHTRHSAATEAIAAITHIATLTAGVPIYLFAEGIGAEEIITVLGATLVLTRVG